MQTSEAILPDKPGVKKVQSDRWKVGAVVSYRMEQGAYIFHGENASILVQPVNETIVRVRLLADQQLGMDSTIAVQQEAYQEVPATLEENDEEYRLRLPALTVSVRKLDAHVNFYNIDGELISGDDGIFHGGRGEYGCRRHMEPDSHIYGLGEKTSFLDKIGEKYDMWNSDVYDPHVPEIECLYVSIPFMIHFRYGKPAYGIFLDNPGRTSFDMRTDDSSYSFRIQSGALDYYFIYGPELKDVVTGYSGLTGRMEIPPAWAIGYHQSRYSYMNQEEVLELARTFREKRIPCDVIYLDIHYMDEYRVFTFDPVRFPNPRKMMNELLEMGIRVVPIVDPGVKKDPEYGPYQEGIRKDYFCRKLEGELFIGKVWPGDSAFPDFTEEEIRSWWGEQHRYYTDLGIHGIWNDMNEPAVFNASKTMDPDVVHGNDGHPKTHRELHNLYGMLMSMATQQGLKKQLAGERPFVLTRAGYAGIQKYAATWTGDNRSFWEHLALSIPMVLNLGLSGQPFAGPDIGGFAHNTTPELLARWTQAGAFFPYCRNHSVLESIRQEPWVFGPEIEEICRKYIRLRYRLMPYLYTLFRKANETGLPVMRALIMEYPDDRNVYNCCDQFLVGKSLLVAPILRPGTECRAVYLPEGEWIDYWTGERHEGGRHILAHAPLDVLPLYVQAGAVIPELEDEEWKPSFQERSNITLTVYGGQVRSDRSYGEWYEDDTRTYAYENGAYNKLTISAANETGSLSLGLRYQHRGLPTSRKVLDIRVKQLEFNPGSVQLITANGSFGLEEAGGNWSFDPMERELKLEVANTFEELELIVEE